MNVAIAGYGVEGTSNYAYWNALPGTHVTIVDEHEVIDAPLDAAVISGPDAFSKLNGFDVVVRTAGLAPHKIKTDGMVWSATNEFFKKCPAPIIGVTGSKGKGTTSSLIASMLEAAGKKVWLIGNIGVPALDILPQVQPEDIIVYELSSFQLWDVESSPTVAVVLHIEPDHLDVHTDFDEYVAAKGNIAAFQITTDRVVYTTQNQWSEHIARLSVGQRLPYPAQHTAHIQGDYFYYGDVELCAVENLLLPGLHNQQNACAAITAVWPWVQDGQIIAEGLRGFDGLPHRLKFVREVSGVRYYDDSIATTPGSAIAAIAAFPEPKVLILGGSYKGADFAELAERVLAGSVRKVLLIGEEAVRISEELSKVGYEDFEMCVEVPLAEVVTRAAQNATPGDVVILSPACASFGQFKNYIDRGEQFIAAVEQL